MRNQTLKVLPNPWFYLDDQANPAGIVPVDPSVNRNRSFVGAEMVDVQILDDYQKGYMLSPRRYHNWKFTDKVVELPATPYYVDAVKSNTLLPADEKTAKLCQVEYKEPSVRLEQAKVAAAKHWKAAYGEYPEWFNQEDPPPASNVIA